MSHEHGDNVSGADGRGSLSVARHVVPPSEREVSILPPAELSYYGPQSPDFVLQMLPSGLHRVLDIGCGTGKLGKELKAHGVDEVIGVEAVPEAAEAARQHLDRVFVGDIEDLDILCPDGYFDAIVYSGVLEHLVDPHFELFRRRRLLRSGGVVAALLPNVQHYSVVMELLAGRWTLQSAGEMDATHLRWFTLHEIRRMFDAAGFAVEDVRGHVFGSHPATYQQMIDALQPLGLMNPDFARTTDIYIYTLRAQKLDDWKPADRTISGAQTRPNGLFTGERAMPLAANMDGAVMREHWARYRRVLPLVRGKTVLDVACGTGYGSDLLAQGARSVLGGDVDAGAVAYCAKHYDRPNLSFAAMDIRQLPLPDCSVDVVVSFETLEHVVDGERFLAEVTRVLRSDGTLAISVPLGGRAGNPYHLAYYQRGTFASYLSNFFDDVEIVV
ncbi:MAG: class I SAM-dependent methyltransferase, partial [Anaerolineae bacterium]